MAQRKSGLFGVGHGHKLYYEWWGRGREDKVILNLHGGPGGGFSDSHKLLYDDARHRVLFYDQRGAGRSTPYGSLKHNTTQDLADDISRLLDHFSIEKVGLVGGSWGSTLALVYAIQNPGRVEKLLLSGVFLGTREELNYLNKGEIKSHFPDVWERFLSLVPPKQRTNPEAYYARQVLAGKSGSDQFAREWVLFEASLGALDVDPRAVMQGFDKDDRYKLLAKIEAHYFMNDCFLPTNYILRNCHAIGHIPTTIVQGRYDFVCAPQQAYQLHKALPHSKLRFTLGGHSRNDAVTREVIKTYLENF